MCARNKHPQNRNNDGPKVPKDSTEPPKPAAQESPKFHLFLNLPKEIQLMIWRLFHNNQPVIFHYLVLTNNGRYYAAYDTANNKVVETTAYSADLDISNGQPADPYEYKIRFTGSVGRINQHCNMRQLVSRALTFNGDPNANYYNFGREPRWPTYTWANFHKDVFIVGSNYRLPGHVRPLFQNIRWAELRLWRGHWAHQIQKLGIIVRSLTTRLPQQDRTALAELRGLRKVYLIMQEIVEPLGLQPLVGDRQNPHLMKGLVPLEEHMQRLSRARLRHPRWHHIENEADGLRSELLDVFKEAGRPHVEVELVVDLSKWNIPRYPLWSGY